jgi:hypothetical protein
LRSCSGLPSLALADLVLGLMPASSASSHAAGNPAYGIIGAVLIAPALAAQVRAPDPKVAPLQQIALVALALACAAVASGAYIGIAGAAIVLVSLVVVLALHPGRRDALRLPRRPSAPLLAAAAAFLFGVASLVNPDVAASGGRGWGAAAVVWSAAWLATTVRESAND